MGYSNKRTRKHINNNRRKHRRGGGRSAKQQAKYASYSKSRTIKKQNEASKKAQLKTALTALLASGIVTTGVATAHDGVIPPDADIGDFSDATVNMYGPDYEDLRIDKWEPSESEQSIQTMRTRRSKMNTKKIHNPPHSKPQRTRSHY